MEIKVKLTQLAIVPVTLLFLSACQRDSEPQQTSQPRPVKVAEVKLANGFGTKKFPATVEPNYNAQLAFRVNGEVAKVNVVAGMKVSKGKTLATLDNTDFELQVKQAKARYDLSASQFKRSEQLFKDKLIASSMYDEAKAQLDIAEAQLDTAKTNLKYTQLQAPFDGMIAQVHVEPFEFVQAKQPILELQGRESIDIAIQVPELLMAKLPKAEQIPNYQPTLVLDAKPESQYKVSIKEFDITPNPATQSYKMVFTMDAPTDINILAGMTGSLFVELNQVFGMEDNAFSVPNSAIFRPNKFAGENRHFIYKINNENRTELIEIEVVKVNQDSTLIKPMNSSLKAGYQIVAAGSHLIQEGQIVMPWKREGGL
jgi:RND family efflux transporter MFP subunit